MQEITYIPITRKGELIFNLLFLQAKASSRWNLDKKMKHNDKYRNEYDEYEYFFLVFLIYFKGFSFHKQSTGLQTQNLSNLFVQAPRQQSLSYAQTQ